MNTEIVNGGALTPEQRTRVEENLGLVGLCLKKIPSVPAQPMTRCEYDDLFQEGTLGLMRAVVRFDPLRNRTFVAFALKHIHGALSRALADRFATIRVPVKAVKQARRELRERRAAEASMDGARHENRISASSRAAFVTPANLGPEDVLLQAREETFPSDGRRLGDLLRERYEAAVLSASEGIRRRGRGRSDRGELIDRLVRDRLLIPEETERTSLRQIARDLKSTAGRVLACERQIAAWAADILQQDPVYRRLRELSVQTVESLQGEIDETTRQDLARREARHFRAQMARLSEEQLQTMLSRLVEHVFGGPGRLLPVLFGALGADLRGRVLMDTLSRGTPGPLVPN